MDKVRRLEMVVRAADLGGFAAAAKHMNITPSAVSRGIAELERALRISIFKRSTRHIQLTEEGRELYHRALDVLERLAAIEVTANAVDKQINDFDAARDVTVQRIKDIIPTLTAGQLAMRRPLVAGANR